MQCRPEVVQICRRRPLSPLRDIAWGTTNQVPPAHRSSCELERLEEDLHLALHDFAWESAPQVWNETKLRHQSRSHQLVHGVTLPTVNEHSHCFGLKAQDSIPRFNCAADLWRQAVADPSTDVRFLPVPSKPSLLCIAHPVSPHT